MSVLNFELSIQAPGRGLHPISDQVLDTVSGKLPSQGLLNLFIVHTSASLLIQENADPSAKQDLESFLNRLIPDGQEWHKHTLEGDDDTTSHMKSALTATSLNIPICDGKLGLGTWQGIYLWEHRKTPHNRRIILTVVS